MTIIHWLPRLTAMVLGGGLFFISAQAISTQPTTLTPLFVEDFDQKDNWEPLDFPLQSHSAYDITPEGYLRASSDNSVSAIVLAKRFEPAVTPMLSWRWNVDNTFTKGNAEEKSGDDFPLRVSVCFKFDPKKVNANERRWFKMQKLVWGDYPPYRVLHYVYASRDDLPSDILPCPYSERARIIVKRSGQGDLQQWHEERVDIMEDFRKAFGEEPPKEAVISIMADSDNTNESSTAYVDWIQVSPN
ncbi:DUF3047 domain-containing protein [Cerasicoccus fimbriatus]|uniref:DUF3047 domain-containing protein n=1 Tax=Cerasicoccus fimbriatus TaxID=3014554 RepID=UPI0022B50D82|nr:DUF3047 domain-containing protein [Cerasicoccus sp. TK19100]